MATSSAKTVDAYLASLAPPQRAALERVRRAIAAAAPGAEEGWSYGLPAFRLGGKPIAGFAAHAGHCSYYPMSASVVASLPRSSRPSRRARERSASRPTPYCRPRSSASWSRRESPRSVPRRARAEPLEPLRHRGGAGRLAGAEVDPLGGVRLQVEQQPRRADALPRLADRVEAVLDLARAGRDELPPAFRSARSRMPWTTRWSRPVGCRRGRRAGRSRCRPPHPRGRPHRRARRGCGRGRPGSRGRRSSPASRVPASARGTASGCRPRGGCTSPRGTGRRDGGPAGRSSARATRSRRPRSARCRSRG